VNAREGVNQRTCLRNSVSPAIDHEHEHEHETQGVSPLPDYFFLGRAGEGFSLTKFSFTITVFG
jgi:hypothetical protein